MSEILNPTQKVANLREMIEKYPLKCKLFMNLLLSNLPQCQQIQTPKDFKKAYSSFIHIFFKQSSEEQLCFIEYLADHVNQCLKNQRNRTTNIVKNIQTSCEMKTSRMGINYWQKRTFKFDYQENNIKLSSSKKDEIIHLRMFLVRKSNSEKDTMVFQAVQNGVSDKLSKVSLKFKNSSIFNEIYGNIRKVVFQLLEKKVEEMISEDLKQMKNEKTIESSRNNQGFNILTTKNLTEYFNNKQKMSLKLQKYRLNAFMISNKNNTKIYRSQQNKKCYYLEQSISPIHPQTIDKVKQNIPILASQTIRDKMQMEVLQVFNKNITANYYKLDVGMKQYQFLVINQKSQKEGCLNQTIKAATDFFLDISIEFATISLELKTQTQFSLKMSLIINTHKKKSLGKDINELLSALTFPNASQQLNVKFNKKGSEKQNYSVVDIKQSHNKSLHINIVNAFEEEFTTSSGKKTSSESSPIEQEEEENEDEVFYSIAGDDDEEELKIFTSLDEKKMSLVGTEKEIAKNIGETEPTLTEQVNFLKAKAFNEPLPSSQLKILKEHFLFGEWRRSSKGGVVCADQEVIKEQKRILKLVFTRIGSNIFKGNSCMNVSLPIQLFRKQSFLVCIGKNLTYAPLLIEPFVSFEPFQRMKNLTVFEISLNGLSLSTRKPFNPILGETYQGQIAGCPVFLEQISHHPPITSIFMKGRGYKIYGTMKIDVNLRLNYVRGVNHCNMTIEYDNGDKISFDLPEMLLNGLILGERTIYYQGPIHLIDHQHLLISEINYNAINMKKGLFSLKSQSPDFLSGQIYKVSSSFMEKFIQSKKKLSIKKDQGSKVLAKVHGQWNGKIYIDNNLFYDFQEQLPVQLEHHPCPLPSDSFLRADVQEMIRGDINAAQDEKDRLEELQRKDKKLRVAHGKSLTKKK